MGFATHTHPSPPLNHLNPHPLTSPLTTTSTCPPGTYPTAVQTLYTPPVHRAHAAHLALVRTTRRTLHTLPLHACLLHTSTRPLISHLDEGSKSGMNEARGSVSKSRVEAEKCKTEAQARKTGTEESKTEVEERKKEPVERKEQLSAVEVLLGHAMARVRRQRLRGYPLTSSVGLQRRHPNTLWVPPFAAAGICCKPTELNFRSHTW